MDQWWVIRRNRDPVGPVSTDLVLQGIRAGRLPSDALVCELGGAKWRPITEIQSFARELDNLAAAQEESVTESLDLRDPRAKSARRGASRRFDHTAETTLVDDSPMSSADVDSAIDATRALRPFDDTGEQTIVESSPMESEEPRSVRRRGLRSFEDGEEQTVVDALPLRPSEPP
ncbi:MAG TPA: GYF domain-containing protein [Polyangiaceae bacterium]|nr:GYF domain-containing protein [Polyangiaceae bacterium]